MKVVVFLWRNGEFEVYGWSLEMGLSGNICVVEIMVEEERTCSMAVF